MLTATDRQIAERFKQRMLERGLPVAGTIVFGSRARGDYEPDSDLDVLVLLDRKDFRLVDAVRDCAWEVGFDNEMLIQTIIRTRDEVENSPLRVSLLMQAIRAEGVSV